MEARVGRRARDDECQTRGTAGGARAVAMDAARRDIAWTARAWWKEVVALALRHRSSEVRVEALRILNGVCALVTRTRFLGSAISSYSFKITHDPGRRARSAFLNFFSVHVVRHATCNSAEFALDGFVVHLLLELVHRRGVERLDTPPPPQPWRRRFRTAPCLERCPWLAYRRLSVSSRR